MIEVPKEMVGNMLRASFMKEPLAVVVLLVCALQKCSNHSSGCSGSGHSGNASQFVVPSSTSYSTKGGSLLSVSDESSSLESSSGWCSRSCSSLISALSSWSLFRTCRCDTVLRESCIQVSKNCMFGVCG